MLTCLNQQSNDAWVIKSVVRLRIARTSVPECVLVRTWVRIPFVAIFVYRNGDLSRQRRRGLSALNAKTGWGHLGEFFQG